MLKKGTNASVKEVKEVKEVKSNGLVSLVVMFHPNQPDTLFDIHPDEVDNNKKFGFIVKS